MISAESNFSFGFHKSSLTLKNNFNHFNGTKMCHRRDDDEKKIGKTGKNEERILWEWYFQTREHPRLIFICQPLVFSYLLLLIIFFLLFSFFFSLSSLFNFLVTCYATLHPALSVSPSVGPSVRPSHLLWVLAVFCLTAPA